MWLSFRPAAKGRARRRSGRPASAPDPDSRAAPAEATSEGFDCPVLPSYVFLASDEGRHCEGQCISPNGGDVFLQG